MENVIPPDSALVAEHRSWNTRSLVTTDGRIKGRVGGANQRTQGSQSSDVGKQVPNTPQTIVDEQACTSVRILAYTEDIQIIEALSGLVKAEQNAPIQLSRDQRSAVEFKKIADDFIPGVTLPLLRLRRHVSGVSWLTCGVISLGWFVLKGNGVLFTVPSLTPALTDNLWQISSILMFCTLCLLGISHVLPEIQKLLKIPKGANGN